MRIHDRRYGARLQSEQELYQRLYELTNPVCSSCTIPFNCCSPMFCEIAASYTERRYGADLAAPSRPRTPGTLIGMDGCIAKPWQRPVCTGFVCPEMIPLQTPEWQREYALLNRRMKALVRASGVRL